MNLSRLALAIWVLFEIGCSSGDGTAHDSAVATVDAAVCVVDREEGGSDALARVGVRLRSLYRAGDLLAVRPQTDNPHG